MHNFIVRVPTSLRTDRGIRMINNISSQLVAYNSLSYVHSKKSTPLPLPNNLVFNLLTPNSSTVK